VQRNGERDFDRLLRSYTRAIKGSPGSAEPFAVVVPHAVEHRGGVRLLDRHGRSLPIARATDSGAFEVMARSMGMHTPAWVAGRVIEVDGRLMLAPFSMGLESDGLMKPVRLV
ncbi:MAG: hypothetical protein KC416_10800, partial [Myxococcales bacterium]|nr:hypothetical protein [Myxococcales bacterium]